MRPPVKAPLRSPPLRPRGSLRVRRRFDDLAEPSCFSQQLSGGRNCVWVMSRIGATLEFIRVTQPALTEVSKAVKHQVTDLDCVFDTPKDAGVQGVAVTGVRFVGSASAGRLHTQIGQ